MGEAYFEYSVVIFSKTASLYSCIILDASSCLLVCRYNPIFCDSACYRNSDDLGVTRLGYFCEHATLDLSLALLGHKKHLVFKRLVSVCSIVLRVSHGCYRSGETSCAI